MSESWLLRMLWRSCWMLRTRYTDVPGDGAGAGTGGGNKATRSVDKWVQMQAAGPSAHPGRTKLASRQQHQQPIGAFCLAPLAILHTRTCRGLSSPLSFVGWPSKTEHYKSTFGAGSRSTKTARYTHLLDTCQTLDFLAWCCCVGVAECTTSSRSHTGTCRMVEAVAAGGCPDTAP